MKKYIIFAIIFCFHLNILFSQDFRLPLWEKNIPNQNEIKVKEIIETTNAIRIKDVSNPTIEVFLPTKASMTGEAIVICPGGGYEYVVYDKEGTDVAKMMNSQGIVGIVLKYRLPKAENNIEGRLSPFLDAQRAVRLTRYHAKDWGIDSNKIGIMGFSAGGHVASTLGTHYQDNFFITDNIDSIDCRPDFMVLMYPVITFRRPYLHLGSRNNLIGENPDTSLVNYYSNELHITNNTPPTFLVHATDDHGVPVENSLMFYNNLRKHNVKCELHLFQEGGHGFGLATKKGRLASWKDLCTSWIKEITGEQ